MAKLVGDILTPAAVTWGMVALLAAILLAGLIPAMIIQGT